MFVSASVQLEVGLEVGVVRAQMAVVHSVLQRDIACAWSTTVHFQVLQHLAKRVRRERAADQTLQRSIGVHVRWLQLARRNLNSSCEADSSVKRYLLEWEALEPHAGACRSACEC